MWVLSTDRAELHFFASPERVPGGYAILSHVWARRGEPEQTFQDLQRLKKRCARPWTCKTPRDLASAKIRRCCELAQRHGYGWVWIDTCCIDKSSSAELQEAINSMFRYYALAEVCYAYLEDVPTESAFVAHPHGGTAFNRSAWYGRGWTLQELIAPQFLIFLSQSWVPLGSKADLAEPIGEETGIPLPVLRGEEALDQFSIAQRMSWAAKRETTRMEDEAYCLMGLFDVNMPTIYGEGRKAFQRLQEEIMRRNPDTTLFAWGDICNFDEPVKSEQRRCTLFAQSPADFRGCGSRVEHRDNMERRGGKQSNEVGVAGNTTLSVTPRGVLATVRVMEARGFHFADLAWCDQDEGKLLLCIAPRPGSPEDAVPVFEVARHPILRLRSFTSESTQCRLLRMRAADVDPSAPTSHSRIQVYLAYGTGEVTQSAPSLPRLPMDTSLDAPFRVHKYALVDVWNSHQAVLKPPMDIIPQSTPESGYEHSPAAFSLIFSEIFGSVDVRLGLCARSGGNSRRVHWAHVRYTSSALLLDQETSTPDHDCRTDHICGWVGLEKTFCIVYGHQFTLRFTRCGLFPKRTMVLQTIQAVIEDTPMHLLQYTMINS
ncbi:HET-domain-containing protein [Lentinus tigrinus ALCF2SS1-7]|uniref:HET-domain-containing protein n=1 Tax=Lentinus tigrinus ALCF2SS1-6 TaxID=1328759 RepID=A0A5C2SJR0_9APHY|nr:HET-domain-containing protein [Lentinus tigrinus ALCF2SS1-6]RPD76255.1 HET-domain-containing protein [Lentinus tigrinus ALCF2SS1-7]